MTVQLGDRVRDRITGFEGIVIGITEWLYQCRRPIVQPSGLTTDGKLRDTSSFDEDQLEIIEIGAFTPKVVVQPPALPAPVKARTGGPRDVPTRQPTPRL